ncbi:MAG: response regulator [bacterium]|nr:response regulator [bacterium]
MSIRTLIVDDEPLARELVRSLLKGDDEIEILTECANGREALEAIKTFRPDLMFLDVQMPGLSGFQLLENVETGLMPYIIFITAYDKYAVRAFEIHALDYLLKPFEKERFYESLSRAKAVIRQQTLSGLTDKIFQLATSFGGPSPMNPDAQRNGGEHQSSSFPAIPTDDGSSILEEIVIRDGGRLLAVKMEDIIWLEAANQYLRIHTLKGSHLLSRSLDALQKRLDPDRFFRIHRSAIVHSAFIKEVRTAKNGTCDVILANGKSLRLSRSRRSILPHLLKHCT